MNGIAVSVGRIKGRFRGDITGTVNYWVLVVRWTRSQIRGTSPLRVHEPKVCFDIFTFLSIHTTTLPLLMSYTPFECFSKDLIDSTKDLMPSFRKKTTSSKSLQVLSKSASNRIERQTKIKNSTAAI
jgi:hypothetical protein